MPRERGAEDGAGDGNRTRIASLEGWNSAIELHPRGSSVATAILPAVEVAFRLVDVFTDVPFAGNQLCVVPEPPAGLDTETMATLTREIGFSETTFVTAVRQDGYDVRIFTPDAELPFAGHPTLGTAFVLVSEERVSSSCVQTSEAGDVAVDVDVAAGTAWMQQMPPLFGYPVDDRAAVARAAGLELGDLVEGSPIVAGSTGLAHLMVPLRDERALRRARRDDAGCEQVCDAAEAESLYLFAVRADGDVMARMFDRGAIIGEDPATGSAVGPLGAYLAHHGLAGMPGTVVVAQGEMVGRPSFLHVEAQPEGDSFSVRVGGGVRIVGEGSFRVG
jgi:trans-2,3-dihydro-3-hydroxyanthranilate isomerase